MQDNSSARTQGLHATFFLALFSSPPCHHCFLWLPLASFPQAKPSTPLVCPRAAVLPVTASLSHPPSAPALAIAGSIGFREPIPAHLGTPKGCLCSSCLLQLLRSSEPCSTPDLAIVASLGFHKPSPALLRCTLGVRQLPLGRPVHPYPCLPGPLSESQARDHFPPIQKGL